MRSSRLHSNFRNFNLNNLINISFILIIGLPEPRSAIPSLSLAVLAAERARFADLRWIELDWPSSCGVVGGCYCRWCHEICDTYIQPSLLKLWSTPPANLHAPATFWDRLCRLDGPSSCGVVVANYRRGGSKGGIHNPATSKHPSTITCTSPHATVATYFGHKCLYRDMWSLGK